MYAYCDKKCPPDPSEAEDVTGLCTDFQFPGVRKYVEETPVISMMFTIYGYIVLLIVPGKEIIIFIFSCCYREQTIQGKFSHILLTNEIAAIYRTNEVQKIVCGRLTALKC